MTGALDDLFDDARAAAGWRQPTQGEHVCGRCRGAACYGLGTAWFCPRCAPADFLPKDRSDQR